MPNEVSRFIQRRTGCDHFRGEEAYDEARARFIRENLEKLCRGSDAELKALKQKHASRGDVMQRLSQFEEGIE